MDRSLERVASGKRINSGRDDDAGLAISSRMKAQAQSLRRTALNIEEGVALEQVADSGLRSVADRLFRLRELAVQSANDTNTSADRAYMQREVDQVLMEIDRVSRQTEIFGRRPLFDPLGKEVQNPPGQVDIGFLVDNSGSMAGEIANLKAQVQSFKDRLLSVSDDVRFGLQRIGVDNDNVDSADMRADIGGSTFDSELALLGTAAGGGLPGGSMDTYAAMSEALGGSDTAGTRERTSSPSSPPTPTS